VNSKPEVPKTPSTTDSSQNSNNSESSPVLPRPQLASRSQSAEKSERSPVLGRPQLATRSQSVGRNQPDKKKFGFFKATSPRVEAAQKSLAENRSSKNNNKHVKTVGKLSIVGAAAPLPKELSTKDTSSSTQTISTGSSSDEEDPSKTKNNTTAAAPSRNTKSLASAWETQIQRASQQRNGQLVNNKQQSPDRKGTVKQSSPKLSPTFRLAAAIASKETFDEQTLKEDSTVGEEAASTSTTPLKVTNQPNIAVAAQWQERIRQKQGKKTSPIAVVPAKNNNTDRIEKSGTMLLNQTSGSETVPKTPTTDYDEIAAAFSTPLFGTKKQTQSDSHQMVERYFHFHEPGAMALVPFNPLEDNDADEKKDPDAQDHIGFADSSFDDVMHELTLNLGGGEDQAWVNTVMESDMFQNMTNEYLLEIICDAERRWQDSSKLSQVIVPSQLLSLNLALDHDDSEKARVILMQQSEIADLKAQLAEQTAKQHQLEPPAPMLLEGKKVADAFDTIVKSTALTTTTMLMPPSLMPTTTSLPSSSVAAPSTTVPESSVPGSSVPGSCESPVELIDSVPIEHIEVAHTDDPDVCSVTSGLTNLHDLVRTMGDAEAASLAFAASSSSFADPFVFDTTTRKSSRSPERILGSTRIVRRVPLELKAADGSNRKALYTGPVSPNGSYTGFGYFQFEGTGDVYKGEVLNGQMHGQGTYTYARRSRRSKNRQHKVLRGTFENNVFTGWDPHSAPTN